MGEPDPSQCHELAQSSLVFADSLVCEYLLFRGYVKTFQVFTGENTTDSLRTPADVNVIADNLFHLAHEGDYTSMMRLWNFVEARFEKHLDDHLASELQVMRSSLQRYFIVHSVKANRVADALEFLEAHSSDLLDEDGQRGPPPPIPRDPSSAEASTGLDARSWSSWYSLPFLADPAKHPAFAPFFTARWHRILRASLKSLLSAMVAKAPLPQLLTLDLYRLRQAAELERANAAAAALQEELDEANAALTKLRASQSDLVSYLRTLTGSSAGASRRDAGHPAVGTRPQAREGDSIRAGGSRESDQLTVRELYRLSRLIADPHAQSVAAPRVRRVPVPHSAREAGVEPAAAAIAADVDVEVPGAGSGDASPSVPGPVDGRVASPPAGMMGPGEESAWLAGTDMPGRSLAAASPAGQGSDSEDGGGGSSGGEGEGAEPRTGRLARASSEEGSDTGDGGGIDVARQWSPLGDAMGAGDAAGGAEAEADAPTGEPHFGVARFTRLDSLRDGRISALRFNATGSLLATVSRAGTLRLWKMQLKGGGGGGGAEGGSGAGPERELLRISALVNVVERVLDWAWVQGDRALLGVTTHGHVITVSAHNAHVVSTVSIFSGWAQRPAPSEGLRVAAAAWVDADRLVAVVRTADGSSSSGGQQHLLLWSSPQGAGSGEVVDLAPAAEEHGAVATLACSGAYALLGFESGLCRVYSLEDGSPAGEWSLPETAPTACTFVPPWGERDGARAVMVVGHWPDAEGAVASVYTLGPSADVARAGTVTAPVTAGPTCVAASGDGYYVALGLPGLEAPVLHRVDTGEFVQTLDHTHTGDVVGVAWHPTLPCVVSCGDDEALHCYALGRRSRALGLHPSAQ